MKSSHHQSGLHSVIIILLCFVDFIVYDRCPFDILVNIRFCLHALLIRHTTEFCSGFPDGAHQNIKAFNKCFPSPQAWILTTSVSIHTLHVHMSAILLQSPGRAELLSMRSSATASGQFLAWRAVDGQTEEIAWLAEVGVPVAVRDEIDEG